MNEQDEMINLRALLKEKECIIDQQNLQINEQKSTIKKQQILINNNNPSASTIN